ncbi:unnamed protein product [Staurois parvus]|uniref:Uncharacterized protein n=1 Tax=Staurois parvus TaxID=386267 RepID=A0ABN9GWC3_9NEOB|nr:unnamed protein product [Staurois parvus]
MASLHPTCARSQGARSTEIQCPLYPPDTVKHRSIM